MHRGMAAWHCLLSCRLVNAKLKFHKRTRQIRQMSKIYAPMRASTEFLSASPLNIRDEAKHCEHVLLIFCQCLSVFFGMNPTYPWTRCAQAGGKMSNFITQEKLLKLGRFSRLQRKVLQHTQFRYSTPTLLHFLQRRGSRLWGDMTYTFSEVVPVPGSVLRVGLRETFGVPWSNSWATRLGILPGGDCDSV